MSEFVDQIGQMTEELNRRIPSPSPGVVEPVPAPEFLVDGFGPPIINYGVAKLPFFSTVPVNGAPGAEHRINLRLAMSIGALVTVHDGLGRLIDQLKQDGTILAEPPQAN